MARLGHRSKWMEMGMEIRINSDERVPSECNRCSQHADVPSQAKLTEVPADFGRLPGFSKDTKWITDFVIEIYSNAV